jgi:hypothetical protein
VTHTAVGAVVVTFVVIFGAAGLMGLALALARAALDVHRSRRSRLQPMDVMRARDE